MPEPPQHPEMADLPVRLPGQPAVEPPPRRIEPTVRWYGPSLVLLATVLVVMLAGPELIRQVAAARTEARLTQISNELAEDQELQSFSRSFTQIAEFVEPSVVHIQVGAASQDGSRLYSGNGSGWVYDDAGHIITNHHVVRMADRISVRFADGAELRARVVGSDERTDIAVLKVEAGELFPARRGADPLRQGDIVFAFGSPLRFEFSMSQGIVSAQGRRLDLLGQGGYENFIQTDAAINPGNSGGPLTNIRGEVIGMNTAIANDQLPDEAHPGARGFMGLGFAIPIGMIEHVADQLIEEGEVRRGFLGVSLPARDMDAAMAESFGFDGRGVVVEGVVRGGPADRAGLQRGDIITGIAGRATPTIESLRRRVAQQQPGTSVRIRFFRDGREQEVDVDLVELPQQGAALPWDRLEDASSLPGVERLRRLGLTGLSTLTPEMARQREMEPIAGVLIRAVRRSSPADRASGTLAPGLVITRVLDEPVADLQQLAAEVEKLDAGEPIRLSVSVWNPVQRVHEQRFVLIEP
jgi:serine protease Do